MNRQNALRLKFPTDDYLVTWQLPSVAGGTFSAHGSLTVAADRPPTGAAYGDLDAALEHQRAGLTGFPQQVAVPSLIGSLANGANVQLINAQVHYWFPNQAHLDADAAVITLANVPTGEALFDAFEVQIGGLDAIAGIRPIKNTTFPKQSGAGGTWSAELTPEITQEWHGGGATMKLTYRGTMHSFDPYAFSMGFSPVVSGGLAQPIPLRQLLDEWIDPLRRIVSIATGRPEDITYLTVLAGTGADRRDGQVFGSGVSQEPYESTQAEIRKLNSPLRLKTDHVSLLDLIRTWQNLAADHHPLVETYGSMLHARDQHPRSRFLLLLQAIEGIHGHETRASFARRQKTHAETRDTILNLANDVLDTKQRKFLERNLSKRPFGGLESAINWLNQRLPGDSKKALDSTDLISATRSAPTNARNEADALRIIRNHLAHGTKGYDAYELRGVVNVLDRIVRAHALQLLGCPSEVINRVLDAP